MSKELQFRFDSITMQGGTSVSPSVVAFDKRTLYLGQNWTIKLKELNRVNVQEESDDDGVNYSSNDRRYNRYNSGSGQRRHGASHQGTIVTLQGKGKPFTCITTNNNNNDEFHNFLEALKQMHRKVKLKNNEKDPYASSAASNNNRRGGGGIMRSNSRKPLITPTVSRSNQQQQQQQSRSSLHMTPQKMKQSTGAFLSRNRSNNHHDDGAHSNNKTTRGNVLNDNNNNTSPSLNLPPKSPRNATPTKLRRTSEETDSDDDDNTNNHDEFEFDDSKDDSSKRRTKQPSSRVLFHDSVVKRDSRKRVKVSKLQRRIEEKMLDDRSDEDEDEEMKQTEQVMEEEEEETNVMMKKKKRLRKVAVRKDDGEESDGSDLEFDAGTSSTTGDVRKKLRLEDDEDEEDEEGENDSPSPAREEKVKKNNASGKTITDEDTSRETSPVTTEDVVAADNDDDDLEEGEVSSTPEEKPSAKKGPGTLHSFFAPRSALSTSSSKTAKRLPPSTPVPPTPTKKKQALHHPSTPSSRSSSYTWQSSQTVETTPIAMQKQANRWDSVATTTPKKPANPSPALFSSSLDSGAYFSNTPRKTPAGGYGSDYEEEEEEVDDIYGNDTDENTEPPTPPIRTTYHQLQQRNRNQISRRGRRQVYGQRGAVGRARISIRNPYQNDFRRGGNRISEADSALGRKNLGARTLGRDMSRRKLGKASLFPAVIEDQNDDDEEEVDDKPKIPGIQNLGNTCYLSASLQTLYSIPQFLHKLYQSYEELCSFKELPLTTALLEVAVTIGALKEEDVPMISPDTARSTLLSSKAANPSALKKQMDVLTDKFAGYEQRDAHEFLGDLVDFLHEELVDSPSDEKDDESKKSEESNSEDAEEKPATVVTTDLPTDEYFHLKVRVCLKCKSCGYSRSKEELYRHLSIDVGEDDDGESWGVERSLEHFFQAEDRELNCEKCEDGTSATQTMEIISRPKAILLHFKRFIVTQRDNGEMVLRKNKAKIPLKDSLSISSFFSEEEEKPNGLYHLCGVVHHVGNTAFSGHYTTCAKRNLEEESVEEQWVFFDDTVGRRRTINYVTGNETNQKNCYMALYELK